MASRREVERRYREAGVQPPTGKLPEEVLQARLGQKAGKMADRRTRRNRTRRDQRRRAIEEDR